MRKYLARKARYLKYMFHKFIEDGKEIKVEVERWVWGVLYKDGTELHQFDDQGWFHQFKEIKLNEVVLFCMYKPDKMSTARYDIIINQYLKPIHFYRVVNLHQPDGSYNKHKAYVFGYEHKVSGEKCFNFILPDDRVVVSNNKDVDLSAFKLE